MTATATDSRALRSALGQFPTGICVVTCDAGGELLGMTMSSFNSLSLDPPLVLFSIDRRARSLPQWEVAAAYTVNVLAEDQKAISNRFAKQQENKWEGIKYDRGETGAPRLRGVAAAFDCLAETKHAAGDHVLFIARVSTFVMDQDRRPLVFVNGRYGALRDEYEPAAIWPLDIHY